MGCKQRPRSELYLNNNSGNFAGSEHKSYSRVAHEGDLLHLVKERGVFIACSGKNQKRQKLNKFVERDKNDQTVVITIRAMKGLQKNLA